MTADSPEFAAINQVLERHAGELMATPGVAGVAVGLLEDGQTPCLRILVTQLSPPLRAKLPTSLDGHPVLLVETGEIRPLGER